MDYYILAVDLIELTAVNVGVHCIARARGMASYKPQFALQTENKTAIHFSNLPAFIATGFGTKSSALYRWEY
jgi:hypothetical protein